MDGRVSLGDFVFAKEVKLGKYRLALFFQRARRAANRPPPVVATKALRLRVLLLLLDG